MNTICVLTSACICMSVHTCARVCTKRAHIHITVCKLCRTNKIFTWNNLEYFCRMYLPLPVLNITWCLFPHNVIHLYTRLVAVNNIMCVSLLFSNVLGYKITGFPVRIDNTKYARNAYYFNLCFVCDAWARTVQYEPVVKKLSEYLVSIYVSPFTFLCCHSVFSI